jgi:hypothetical protein
MKRATPTPSRMARLHIDQLNADAAQRARAGATSEDAIHATARHTNLILVRYGDNTILYRTRRRAFVNARLEGPHGSYIGPGGAGFDDQIDWAFVANNEESEMPEQS